MSLLHISVFEQPDLQQFPQRVLEERGVVSSMIIRPSGVVCC